jgi:DNA-binding PadR family transcriptional regulator
MPEAINRTEQKYWNELINQSLIQFFILKALQKKGPTHGYLLIEAINEISWEKAKPTQSTIYPALNKLAKEGLLRVEINKRRKVYTLTEQGMTAIRAASKAWNEVIPILQRNTIT